MTKTGAKSLAVLGVFAAGVLIFLVFNWVGSRSGMPDAFRDKGHNQASDPLHVDGAFQSGAGTPSADVHRILARSEVRQTAPRTAIHPLLFAEHELPVNYYDRLELELGTAGSALNKYLLDYFSLQSVSHSEREAVLEALLRIAESELEQGHALEWAVITQRVAAAKLWNGQDPARMVDLLIRVAREPAAPPMIRVEALDFAAQAFSGNARRWGAGVDYEMSLRLNSELIAFIERYDPNLSRFPLAYSGAIERASDIYFRQGNIERSLSMSSLLVDSAEDGGFSRDARARELIAMADRIDATRDNPKLSGEYLRRAIDLSPMVASERELWVRAAFRGAEAEAGVMVGDVHPALAPALLDAWDQPELSIYPTSLSIGYRLSRSLEAAEPQRSLDIIQEVIDRAAGYSDIDDQSTRRYIERVIADARLQRLSLLSRHAEYGGDIDRRFLLEEIHNFSQDYPDWNAWIIDRASAALGRND